MRILFVDDEQNILDGLRNVLRSKRREWDMTFLANPEEAVARIHDSPFDMVISDMRMPRMDGAALLAKVKEIQPHAIRMILSGQTELESVMRSVFVAHMFLAKPCDPASLLGVIERAFRLDELLNSDDLKAAAGRVDVLPGVPEVYMRLNRVLANPDCSVREVAKVIESDVGLCAKILQLVNSAFFGLRRRVSTMDEAITYLGMLAIKNLALALQTFREASESSEMSAAKIAALRDHSLLTGRIAQSIFANDRRRADEAFIAGMLHEVGWLIRAPARSNSGVPAVERPLLGAYLLGLWGLPRPIVEAVAFQSTPESVEHTEFDLVDAVWVADHLATEIRGAEAPPLRAEYLVRLGVDEARLAAWKASASELGQAARDT